jgi:hypothetical protein
VPVDSSVVNLILRNLKTFLTHLPLVDISNIPVSETAARQHAHEQVLIGMENHWEPQIPITLTGWPPRRRVIRGRMKKPTWQRLMFLVERVV